MKWKHFPRYWPFVRGIHRSPVNSPHKGQRRGTLMFSLICGWTNGWVNHRDAGDLRCHRTHYDVTVKIYCAIELSIGINSFNITLDRYQWNTLSIGLYYLFLKTRRQSTMDLSRNTSWYGQIGPIETWLIIRRTLFFRIGTNPFDIVLLYTVNIFQFISGVFRSNWLVSLRESITKPQHKCWSD